jgi:hypothetical protein
MTGAERQRRYREKRGPRATCVVKAANLRRYGLSLADYEAMLAAQRGLCAICSAKMATPCVDHCHRTDAIRGLLCASCNGGLGLFRDSPWLLEAAAYYLSRREPPCLT